MLLLNKSFRGRYLLTEDEQGILGRDVLAGLRMIFEDRDRNGPSIVRRCVESENLTRAGAPTPSRMHSLSLLPPRG